MRLWYGMWSVYLWGGGRTCIFPMALGFHFSSISPKYLTELVFSLLGLHTNKTTTIFWLIGILGDDSIHMVMKISPSPISVESQQFTCLPGSDSSTELPIRARNFNINPKVKVIVISPHCPSCIYADTVCQDVTYYHISTNCSPLSGLVNDLIFALIIMYNNLFSS